MGPVLVIGTGLIGTSIALALRRENVEVYLEDTDPLQVGTAEGLGAGLQFSAGLLPRLVVVAVPPRHAGSVLAQASLRFPEATLTDVTSVKAQVLNDAIAEGADPSRLIGGHPMAGREISGAAGARVDLLDDRLWVLTPAESCSVEHLRQVYQLVSTCGAYAVEMTPDEHDRAVALVSHAPQLLSSILAGQLTDASADYVRIAGQGLRDMTRIADSDSLLWTDILSVNAKQVAAVLSSVVSDLTATLTALQAIAAGDATQCAKVSTTLQAGAAGRSRIPGKHGAAQIEITIVGVMLADKPGELARLFAAAGESNVNLEDVRIEHVLGRPSGLVEISVRPDSAETLSAALRERNFDVRI
ncbi:MAG: prephenate dehydrogenase [Candidatus Nanopelagicales bacterium]|nr:prephenate dehydrogenase [Candidatus Nanopelagicales bacterium]